MLRQAQHERKMDGQPANRLAILAPFSIVTLIWGSTWFVIRDQVSVVPASWSVTYRFAVAAIVMAIVALVRRQRMTIDARALRFATALGLSQFCMNFNFVYRAEEHITSGLVAVMFALLVVPNAVFGRLFLGQRLSRQFLVGSAVAMAGVALLFVHEARADPDGPAEALTGIALALCAVFSASTANVLQGTGTARAYPMIPMLALSMLIGTVLDAALAFALNGAPVIETRPVYLLGIVYLGMFGSAIAFTLYFGVIRVIGPAKAAYSSVIVPVIAMLLSTAFEGYRWTLLAVGGALLVLAGLIVALRARSPAR